MLTLPEASLTQLKESKHGLPPVSPPAGAGAVCSHKLPAFAPALVHQFLDVAQSSPAEGRKSSMTKNVPSCNS